MLISKALFLSWKLFGIRKYFHQNEILIVMSVSVAGPDNTCQEGGPPGAKGLRGTTCHCHITKLNQYMTQCLHVRACTCMGVHGRAWACSTC